MEYSNAGTVQRAKKANVSYSNLLGEIAVIGPFETTSGAVLTKGFFKMVSSVSLNITKVCQNKVTCVNDSLHCI